MELRELDRRAFLQLAGLAAIGSGCGGLTGGRISGTPGSRADHTLRICNTQIELAPHRVISTTAYNGQFPGPLLRLAVGRRTAVDVYNDTDAIERVHWHGLGVGGDSTSAAETDASLIPARGMRRFDITPRHSGLSFYHSQVIAGTNLQAGLYSAQAGPVFIEPRCDAGRYDREVVLVMKEFEPSLSRRRQGFAIGYESFTINGRMLGHSEPVRVRPGERVLFHVLNASATEIRRIALPGHSFHVVALDGYPVRTPTAVPVLQLGPGERVSAVVEMNRAGVWILGEVADHDRENGMGVVVEYAGRGGAAQWGAIVDCGAACGWDYSRFGQEASGPTPDAIFEMVFARQSAGRGFNRWTVNGRSFTAAGGRPLLQVKRGQRYRVRMHNDSEESYPLYLEGHRFALTQMGGMALAGVTKDSVMIGAHQRIELDFVADCPGRSLFRCGQQLHRDFGLMALIEYV